MKKGQLMQPTDDNAIASDCLPAKASRRQCLRASAGVAVAVALPAIDAQADTEAGRFEISATQFI
jgi:hypothetical protein